MDHATQPRDNDSRFAVGYVTFHLVDVNFTNNLIVGSAIHVNVHHVVGDSLSSGTQRSNFEPSQRKSTYSVASLVVFIFDDEDHVKTRQDGGLEVNVLRASQGQQTSV